MLSRRRFIQSSLAAAVPLSATRTFGTGTHHALGVQLYTVRQQAERDLPWVLKAIAEIGYQQVETYWDIYGHPAAELRRMINEHGLRATSGHFDYEGLDSKIDYAKTLGVDYVICPILPEAMRNTLDGFKRAADQFNIWGEKVGQAGMQFGFHNHNYEFRRFQDTTGFETLMKHADRKLVCLEMDCYWITQAGQDPLQMFKQYGKRIKLLHLKDRKPGLAPSQELNEAAEHFTEVGAGTIDWKSVLAAAEQNGVSYLFVERDSGELPAMESLRVSFKNLQTLL